MSQFLMTMHKEKMRSLKEDATVADDEHWSYPKIRKCARMIKSGQVPEDLQQLYEEGSKHSPPPRLFKSQFINKVFQQNTRGESVFAPGNTQCSKFSRTTLRFAPTNFSLQGWLRLWTKSRETSKLWMMQKDEVMSIRKMVTIMSRQ